MTLLVAALSAATEPPIKWAGGKRWLAPLIKQRLPRYKRLVEPCMGALGFSLGLAPKTALVNDINEHLVNFYRQIQNGLVFNLPYGHNETDYYAARQRFNDQIQIGQTQTPEMAQIFYYLNRTGFNGLCRFNSSGLFNVPFGRYSKINYRENFHDVTQAMQHFQIQHGDYSKIAHLDGDFIYVDPPYDTQFTSYSTGGFGWAEQQQLAHFYAHLGLPVLVSNQATDRILQLYDGLGYTVETISAPRRISSSGDRSDALEMLAWKNI